VTSPYYSLPCSPSPVYDRRYLAASIYPPTCSLARRDLSVSQCLAYQPLVEGAQSWMLRLSYLSYLAPYTYVLSLFLLSTYRLVFPAPTRMVGASHHSFTSTQNSRWGYVDSPNTVHIHNDSRTGIVTGTRMVGTAHTDGDLGRKDKKRSRDGCRPLERSFLETGGGHPRRRRCVCFCLVVMGLCKVL
jgi:hypothetical protein